MITRLAYHFAEPADSPSAAAEVDWFAAQVGKAGGFASGDCIVLDLEEWEGVLSRYSGSLVAWALAWLDRAHAITGALPILYTNRGVLQQYGFTDPRLATYPLHLAAWGQSAPPSPPAPWTRLHFWQDADDGDVPGIAGNVDTDWFLGTPDELRGLGIGGANVTPGAAYSVGPGILTEMTAHGETPACDELYFKQGERDEWSEAVSNTGARYIYLPSVGRVFRYEPAA